MKFKILFGIFNVIIIVAFVSILLLPVFLVGSDYALLFWQSNWILIIAFLLVLAGVNVYFLRNWKLFTYLEAENWSGLKEYLEHEITKRGRAGRQKVQLFLHAAVLTSDIGGIERLETHLTQTNPGLVARFAGDFSLPHLLSAEPERILSFAESYLPEVSGDASEWLSFCRGFAYTLKNEPEQAKESLLGNVRTDKNDVVASMALYLVKQLPLALSSQEEQVVRDTRNRIRDRYTREKWHEMVERESRQLYILAFRGLLNDVEESLFATEG
ncbi:MAG: hypothetical protein EA383_03215 [Spirochaetaceae bacterium]|nr:MAG: hypothetical protein EA383_03215 [Spirochaetaceae bacterium]